MIEGDHKFRLKTHLGYAHIIIITHCSGARKLGRNKMHEFTAYKYIIDIYIYEKLTKGVLSNIFEWKKTAMLQVTSNNVDQLNFIFHPSFPHKLGICILIVPVRLKISFSACSRKRYIKPDWHYQNTKWCNYAQTLIKTDLTSFTWSHTSSHVFL